MPSPALRLRFWLATHAVLEVADSAVTRAYLLAEDVLGVAERVRTRLHRGMLRAQLFALQRAANATDWGPPLTPDGTPDPWGVDRG